MNVTSIDWENWKADETAVITYILKAHEVLLIHKKRGLGAGKINAPGGHIEEGESPEDAAVRETFEEVGLKTGNLRQAGELYFHFLDGLKLKGTVFITDHFTGRPIETDEALPFWCPLSEIPYDKMWADDRHWLPQALEGKTFTGRFIFDKDVMVDMDLVFHS